MNRPSFQTRASFAGWLLVLCYLGAVPALFPGAFALLSRIEGSHGVQVGVAGSETQVVLTHGSCSRGRSHESIHHHSAAAALLVALAEAGGDREPDHVVKFRGGRFLGDCETVAVTASAVTADAAAPEERDPARVAAPPLAVVSRLEHAPPVFVSPAGLVELRSTLLLL